jgi:hypothetical protein
MGKTITVIGIVTLMKKMLTKTKEMMLIFTLEDPTGYLEGVIFPKILKGMATHPKEGMLVKMEGRLDKRGGGNQINVERVTQLDLASMVNKAKEEGFFDPEEKVIHRRNDEAETTIEPVAGEEIAEEPAKESIGPSEEENGTEPMEDRSDYEIMIPPWFAKDDYTALKDVLEHHAGKREAVLLITDRSLQTKIMVDGSEELRKDIEVLIHRECTVES